MDVTTLNKR